LNQERLMVLTLNSDNFPVNWDFMGEGLEKEISYHPRVIFQKPFLVRENVSIILAENTKKDFKNPESKELLKLKRLEKAGNLLGIKFLDYILIDKNDFYSYDNLDLL
ncbi:MAG: JAB domain-containing protein, partial [Halanaerobiales bacterium]